MNPREELFEDVARQFEQLEQPLNLQWMQDRHVTLDEVQTLSAKIALILRGYCALEPQARIEFVNRAVGLPTKDKPAETVLGQRHADAVQQPQKQQTQ